MPMPPRIIFFPGMGADHRLIEPQRKLQAQVDIPPWIETLPGESLAEFARRLIETVDTSGEFFLGGISLGGMLTQEAARHVRCKGLILLSTCRGNSELFWTQRTFGPMARIMPQPILTLSKAIMPGLRRMFGVIDADQARLFNQMLRDTGPVFLRWSMLAAVGWPGAGQIRVPTLQIHGDRDRVIPLHRGDGVHVIEGAGHVMNMSHADTVNRLIQEWMARV